MNNKELFKIMFNGLKADIDYRLGEGDSLEEAKAYARERSVAGPAVWGAITKHYSSALRGGKTKERKLKMETKYASLIKQLERVTEAYNTAFNAAKNFVEITGVQPDILGVTGGVAYFGDEFERSRAIQLGQKKLTTAAIDCGSDFKCTYTDEDARIECTLFGYRVFCLATKGSAEEALLIDLLAAEEKRK